MVVSIQNCRVFQNALALEIVDMDDDLKVSVSLGADINPVENVLLYTSFEHLYFTLPG